MGSAKRVISVAKGQVGYREGYSGGHWNNNQKFSDQVPGLEWSDYQAWCQTFQAWVAMKAGTANIEPRTASCYTAVNWFKSRNRFSYYPAIGAQVFFGSGGGSHVGRVYKYNANTIWTIEGNTNTSGSAEGNGVYLKTRSRKSSYTYGYGMPDFPEGVTTADPKLAKRSGYHYKKTASSPAAPVGGGHGGGGSSVARYTVTINRKKYGYGARGSHVTEVGEALVAAGCDKFYKDGPGPTWSDADTKNYALWQKKLGYSGSDADGVPGKGSLTKLLNEYGDDVPAYISLGTWTNYKLAPGVEDAVEFDHEYADDRSDHYMPGGSQFIHGPATYHGEACIELSGVDEGAQIQVRLSEVDRSNKGYVSNGGRGEYLGTAGKTFIKFPFTDHTGSGQGVRLRMKHFSSKPVTVEQVTLKAHVWNR